LILVDAGPLVALLSAGDVNHRACRAVMAENRDDLGTVWPVLTEAVHLLRGTRNGQQGVLEMVDSGAVRLLALDRSDVPRIAELMLKYRDLPMDLADAALVRVAEREKLRRVFTVDRRDFQVYRPARLGRFAIIP
jgi:predicted nucleic acid-binding protein